MYINLLNLFTDNNECLETGVNCGDQQMCFNTRGDYRCIETPCPMSYKRDPLTGYVYLSLHPFSLF